MMRVDIENMLRQIGDRVRSAPYGYTYMLESLTKNLRELRDRTQAGDMAALDEFFGFYIFSDHKEYKRGAAPETCAKPYQDLRDQLSDEQQARSAELAERLRKAVHKCIGCDAQWVEGEKPQHALGCGQG